MTLRVSELLEKVDSERESIRLSYMIQKVMPDQQLVEGQVYAPDCLDSHGHFMRKNELARVCHKFMEAGLQRSIDVMHNNEVIDAVIVENYIARNHPRYDEGAWVAVTKINDPIVWKAVKDGKINGYSFEILTYKRPVNVKIEFSSWHFGFTDPDPYDKHVHAFLIKMSDDGEILWGQTSPHPVDKHIHTIKSNNVTDAVDGRRHRIHLEN